MKTLHQLKRTTVRLGFPLTLLFLLLAASGALAQVPRIDSVNPNAANIGSAVTISGANFNPTPANDIVYFGAVRAMVVSASPSSITTIVPTGATYAPVTVTVNGLTVSANAPFNVTFGGDIATCTFAPKVEFPAEPGQVLAIAMADLDGDGKSDLVRVNRESHSISIYRNVAASGSVTADSFASKLDLWCPSAPSFPGGPTFGIGDGPIAIAIGDVDGDGKLDLAVVDYAGGIICVYQNQSTGPGITANSFAPPVVVAHVGYRGVAGANLAIADLDGDGKPEILSVSGDVIILRNNSTPGIITFSDPSFYLAPGCGESLAISDLDGDGKPDLAIGNRGCHSLLLVQNASTLGNIAFGSTATFTVSLFPASIAIGDLNSDGKPDIIVGIGGRSDSSQPNVAIFQNRSALGSLTADSFTKIELTLGDFSIVALADLNGDGKLDILGPNDSASYPTFWGTVQNLTTAGADIMASSFAPHVRFLTAETCCAAAASLAIGDLDGDGKPDVLIGHQSGGILSVFGTALPSATPIPPSIVSVSPSAAPIGATVVISGNNFSPSPGENIVYFGSVKATVTAASANSLTAIVPTGATYAPITVTARGLIGSANAPFNLTFSSSGRIDALSFAPGVDLAAQPGVPGVSNPRGTAGVAIGDLDGDGKPDVVTATYSGDSVSVFKNTSTPGPIASASFSRVYLPAMDSPAESGILSIAIGDLDGDGRPEIVAHSQLGFLWIFPNVSAPGTIAFAPRVQLPIGGGFSTHSVMIGDLDGDGRAELIIEGYPGIYIVPNNSAPGGLSFGFPVILEGGFASVTIGDLDGDGKPEIVAANRSLGVSIFRNTTIRSRFGSCSFAPPLNLPAGGLDAQDVAISDFDGDGKLDLIVTARGGSRLPGAGYESILSVFRNVGGVVSITAESFAPRVDSPTSDFVTVLASADLDGDGKPDVADLRFAGGGGPGGVAVLPIIQNITAVAQQFSPDSFARPLGFSGIAPIEGISLPQSFAGSGFPVASAGFGFAIGDLDGDGMPDLVVTSFGSPSVSILRNTVAPCTVPAPSLVSVSSLNGQTIAVRYDEDVTSGSALNPANYSINGGAVSLTSAVMKPDHRTVVLSVSGLSSQPSTPFILTASGIKACIQGASGGGTASGLVQSFPPLISIDLGNPPESYYPGSVYSFRNHSIAVTAAGINSIGWNQDRANFLYETIAGDFDLKVRVSRLDIVLGYTSAGLMVRENLNPGSRNYTILALAAGWAGNYQAWSRDAADSLESFWPNQSADSYRVDYPNGWMRLQRTGQTFTAYISTDGTNWQQVAQATPSAAYPATAYVGLATTSSAEGVPTTAEYNDFGPVVPPDVTPPVVTCPANIVTTTAPGQCAAFVSYSPTATDNSGRVTVICSPASGSTFARGVTTVGCTATDASGNSASCSFTVAVQNPAPTVTITGPASGAVYPVGTTVNFTGTFTDNAGDIHTAQWMFDAITQAGTVNESAGTVSASRSFAVPGVYMVALTVTDACGNSATASTVGGLTAMVVIYDPNAGYVTGGGWINSPTGAYTASLSLTGKANFGFVSKYKKGMTVPDGETEFEFQVASFNFHSTSYEWLVISGAKGQYKGSGTVNNAGNYGFMLTAIDGQINGGGGVDKFRIKIWNKSNNDATVYDNQLGASDSANPTTALGGGSIVIHKE